MWTQKTHWSGPGSEWEAKPWRPFTVLEDLGCDREDGNGAVARRNEKMKEGIVLWFLFMVCLF